MNKSNKEKSGSNKFEVIKEALRKFDTNNAEKLIELIKTLYIDDNIRFEVNESGFGVKTKKPEQFEEDLGLSQDELYNLIPYIIICSYTDFISGKIHKKEMFDEDIVEKIKLILKKYKNNEIYKIILSELNFITGIFEDINYEILTRQIKGKNTTIIDRFATIYVSYMEDRFNPKIVSINVTKIGIERLFRKIKEIKEKLEEEEDGSNHKKT